MQYTAELHGWTRFISMQDQYNLLAREGGAPAFSQAALSSAAPCSATGRWSRPALHRKPQVRQAKANRRDPVMTCHRAGGEHELGVVTSPIFERREAAAMKVRDDADRLVVLGTGQQHWSTVHAADLADAFRRVLEDESARGRYVIGNGSRPTVAELTEAAAVAIDAPGAVPGSDEEARARLGDYFAEVLLLDQGTTAARARDNLGWNPSHPGLVDEFRHGSYRK